MELSTCNEDYATKFYKKRGKLNKKQAIAICGGLSNTSKMPCKSYGIPAWLCKVGSTLVKIKGSVCEGCYALDRGMYQFANVKNAQTRRYNSLYHNRWVEAIATLIDKDKWFRWHDSGDMQGMLHAINMMKVAKMKPDTKFWIPTREYSLVTDMVEGGMEIPPNVYIRLSAHMIDGEPPSILAKRLNAYDNCKGFIGTSGVAKDKLEVTCPAHEQDNECKECRKCWSTTENVNYKYH